MWTRIAVAVVYLLAPSAASLFGQAVTSLNGLVVDPTGASVPEASLLLTNIETNAIREAATDVAGRYLFPGVTPGTYRLKASKSGFTDVSVQNLRLLVNTPVTLNLTFEKVGSVQQIIEVSAEAISLNTVDATLGNSFGTRQVTQLPLEGRRADRLLSLQAGVSYIGDSDTVNGGSSLATDRNGVVNGGRSDQSNITLDGVDINNQQTRDPFQGALRVTLDSVQEFRVTTTNSNADASRGSGAQISLITRSGTNQIHGAAYEYLRNRTFNANTFFNNLTVDANGKALPTPKLNRNIFGARLGGPIKKDKLFYFFNYEGQRDRLESSIIRTVPREHIKQGNVRYLNVNRQTVELTPQELLGVVPDAGGISQNALNVLRQFPAANDFTTGDGINTAGFRFNAPLARRYNTYVGKIDYVLNDKHRMFVRGQLQNDTENFAPQFPGQPANQKDLNNSKGLAVGWDALLTSSLFSTTRYGFTRQGVESAGSQTYPLVTFRALSSPISDITSFRRISPVHHIAQDFTHTRGAHTLQFGGSFRTYTNDRLNFANSFFLGQVNSSWLLQSGNILSASLAASSVPDDRRILAQARTSFHDATSAVLGLVTQVTSRYNYLPNPDGTARSQPQGEGVPRKFRGDESEIYLQDTWKVRRNFTITPGIRYMYWPAIYEVNGVQTSPSIPLSEWFDRRVAAASAGQSGTAGIPRVLFNLANKGGRPLYDNLRNWSPRLAIAFTPEGRSGLLKKLFGEGKTVIRAGWGMYYDVFGAGLIRAFDASALGLSTSANNSSGRLTVADTPRFVNPTTFPQSLVTPPPPAVFPVEQPNIFQITNSLDDRLRAPYVMRWNFTLSRELASGWVVTASYVASEGRRTLTSEDLATPLNIRDPQSGVDYFTAAKQLSALVRNNAPIGSVQPIPYWENLFPGLAGGGRTATQTAYSVYQDNYPDATSALESLDRFGSPSASRLGRFAYYSPQYSYLRALRSVGMSSYHSMQWGARKRFTNGDQIDFNWTWAHSIDLGSVTENNASTTDGLRGIIINPYNRRQMRGSSDFDQRHLWNAAYVYNLPVGKSRRFGSGMSRAADLIAGGWQLGGIYRQSTGLPVSVGHNRTWPTNYNVTGWATTIGSFADGTNKNAVAPAAGGRSGPNIFQNPASAFRSFGFTDPGEIGNRNNVRGDGIFSVDMNLNKNFAMPWEGHSIQFRWEVFNITNSVRFDPRDINLSLGSPAAFGRYAGTLGGPRVMQFGLRYEF